MPDVDIPSCRPATAPHGRVLALDARLRHRQAKILNQSLSELSSDPGLLKETAARPVKLNSTGQKCRPD
jgi:hypothetical protein